VVTVERVGIPIAGHSVDGTIAGPDEPTGLVIFAHGSGSNRLSPRNQFVSSVLNRAGLRTLRFDLLSPDEADDRDNVFDVELLGGRLLEATDWVRSGGSDLPFGYFGASTGAAAALWAAADVGSKVSAVVSRGGRPDLAGPRLGDVSAPTLLIVGGRDTTVLGLNREAAAEMRCEHRIEVVPAAAHLFQEPGTLEAVAALARDWFIRHLR
jgi:putative phosphoribosyl transferase